MCSHKLVGVGVLDDPCLWESNFAFGKSQRLLRRSLRAKALGFVRFAMLHFQNFVSLTLAQDDVPIWSAQCGYAFSSKLQFFDKGEKRYVL